MSSYLSEVESVKSVSAEGACALTEQLGLLQSLVLECAKRNRMTALGSEGILVRTVNKVQTGTWARESNWWRFFPSGYQQRKVLLKPLAVPATTSTF